MVKRDRQEPATDFWWNVILLSALVVGHEKNETNARPRGNAARKK